MRQPAPGRAGAYTIAMKTELDARALAARDWARQQLGRPAAGFAPASADASFRRYFRLVDGEDSWVLMDAPPAQEDCVPFLKVTALMHAAGLNAPQVLAQDLVAGFLLLSDLGHRTWLPVLGADNAATYFEAALQALVRWQQASRPGVLPAYDRALLGRELQLFPDWFVEHHLGRRFDAVERGLWETVCDRLLDSALAQPTVFVHRDFMPRNLMVSDPNPGILDYQDAVMGPISYDVISLFKDAFISWPQAVVDDGLRRYWVLAREAGLPVDPDVDQFRLQAERMGSQRHLKVLGIFARIRYRDGKPQYLEDAPRFVGYLRARCAVDAEMAPLADLLDRLGLST